MDYDGQRFELKMDNTLVIHDAAIEDSGVYTCYENRKYEAVHHVQVLEEEKLVLVIQKQHLNYDLIL
jgi:hypothetical protein